MMTEQKILAMVRPNILGLRPYSSARDEYSGANKVFLDANENPYGKEHNRYPDPRQQELKQAFSNLKGIPPEQIFLGNGSDEGIDILIRVFCTPGKDNIVIAGPTYGMYEVSADINDVAVNRCDLTPDFQLDTQAVLDATNESSRILFLCSPNNPTGNLMKETDVRYLLEKFPGIVVVDEAYIDYTDTESWASQLDKYPNLVVLQTMSKAWGLAAIRLGLGFASQKIIDIMNKVKPPYNISQETQNIALRAMLQTEEFQTCIKNTIEERNSLIETLQGLPYVQKVFPTDANFVLIRVTDAGKLYNHLISEGVIVRNRSGITHCSSCLRITVGTKEENRILSEALKSFKS